MWDVHNVHKYVFDVFDERRCSMNAYQKELQRLKTDDEIQDYGDWGRTKGYCFIVTSGHGYLVVPKKDKNARIAKRICNYGYEGKLAYYLEEDCETGEFLSLINNC